MTNLQTFHGLTPVHNKIDYCTAENFGELASYSSQAHFVVTRGMLAPTLTLVVIVAHWSIPLVVAVDTTLGAVHWDLVVVGPNSVTMCVRVREQTTL